jgi:hypothetical protein
MFPGASENSPVLPVRKVLPGGPFDLVTIFVFLAVLELPQLQKLASNSTTKNERGLGVLSKGDYVRMKMAPATRLGTIEGIKRERGQVRYHFRQDHRFLEALPGVVFETWVPGNVLESCTPPSDHYVNALNQLINRWRSKTENWTALGVAKRS